MPRLRAVLIAAFALLALAWPASPAAAHEAPVQDRAAVVCPVLPEIGMHVPWAAGGLRFDAAGQLEDFAGEWPDLPVRSLRLWDTRTAWLNLQPARDLWDFTHLDTHLDIARRNGVEHVTLVLWGTPRWAARDTAATDAPWLGPGSAAMPANIADWDAYVRAVATRYAGRIDAYEVGNEPNLVMFNRGTPAELAELVTRAARVIREADPAARIVAPAPVFTDASEVRAAREWWTALAGAGADVDAASFHWYPSELQPGRLRALTREVRSGLAAAGLPPMPLWLTEVSYAQQYAATPARVAALAARTHRAAAAAGLERVYWYAWSSLPIGNLVPLAAGSPMALGLARAIAP
jgi:hypothetical protein